MSKKEKYLLTIELEGNSYKLCDFKGITLIQNKILKKILKGNLEGLQGGKTEIETMLSVLELDSTIELLALLYIESNESRFNIDTYDSRVKEFENLPNYNWIGELVTDFFTFTTPASILQNSLTFLTALK